ncbi:biotin biosynthesis protein BioY [Actinoplanes sp. SE50]|uniref:biotin transporter BioY n=1 Tax=unclassified Actinoplanes TaxID=2626549 RepID=UPI00023EE0E4|nr:MULTISPECIES: biotin transporter BioY [unclassified Actinoplanes]AEV89060.1 putative biotin transporter bioY [Actinoplanes sp. SE50/110]ATO87466.1 biotin biosynthesis protein BioY [Actinoplanes sp. SE50]SLM04884.1 biotin biosynthesis protein BioY [Actinoplanes sp. SE50/110]
MTDVFGAVVPGRPTGVLADVWGRSAVRDLLLIVGAAGAVGAAAQIAVPVPGSPVPITGQTFAVLLAGAVLGPGRGAAGMVLYALAGVLGVPWFAGGTSGWPVATGGYLIGFIVAAALVGQLAALGADRRPAYTIGLMLIGNLLIYLFGVPWLALMTTMDVPGAFCHGLVPYLMGDALKIALATALLPGAWALLNRKRPG